MSPLTILLVIIISCIWIFGLRFSEKIGEFVCKKIINKILDIFK